MRMSPTFSIARSRCFRGEVYIGTKPYRWLHMTFKLEMSALKSTRVVLDAVAKNKYDVINMNFANGDMS